MGEGKKFDLEKRFLAVSGVAAVVVAACGRIEGCAEGLAQGFSSNLGAASFTGGPCWDWVQFSNGRFTCRNIDNGRFVGSNLCAGMPRDNDRWPN